MPHRTNPTIAQVPPDAGVLIAKGGGLCTKGRSQGQLEPTNVRRMGAECAPSLSVRPAAPTGRYLLRWCGGHMAKCGAARSAASHIILTCGCEPHHPGVRLSPTTPTTRRGAPTWCGRFERITDKILSDLLAPALGTFWGVRVAEGTFRTSCRTDVVKIWLRNHKKKSLWVTRTLAPHARPHPGP